MGLGDALKKVAAAPGKLARKAVLKTGDIAVSMALRNFDKAIRRGEYGEDNMKAWESFVKFMDGKKTYTGAALIGLPSIAAAVAGALASAGLDPLLVAKYTAWGGGGVLAFVGVVHRVVKYADDLTPDQVK